MKSIDRIGRRLTLRDLNVFLAVAELGNMSKAARKLAVSQPVVSKAIASMEHTLGVPLLDRTARGVETTPYGRALLQRGLAVFDELRQSVKDIEFLADPTAGEARIGGTPPLVAGIVPAVAEMLARRYPNIALEVIENDFVLLHRSLRERQIDLVIGRSPEPVVDEDIVSEVLFEDRLLVVAGTQNKWVKRKKIELSELLDEHWVFPVSQSIAAPLVAHAFNAMGLKPPRATVTSSSMAMNIHLVTAGRFLALLPASTVLLSAKHQPLKILPVVMQSQPRPIVIATLKNRLLSPLAKLFIESTRELVKSSKIANITR